MNRPENRLLLIALTVVLVVATTGCLFEARSPDPPDEEGSTLVSLDVPINVFTALRTSLNDGRTNNYENLLLEEFAFSPLPEDSLDEDFIGTGAFDNWTKTVELDVINAVFSDFNVDSVAFNPSIDINENEYVRYRVNYYLRIESKAVAGDTTSYAGVAFFDVINDGGNWRLRRWRDIERVTGFPSWGFLRGTTRNRIGSSRAPGYALRQ